MNPRCFLLRTVPSLLAATLLAGQGQPAGPDNQGTVIYNFNQLDEQPSMPTPKRGYTLFSYPNLSSTRGTGGLAMLECPEIHERYQSPMSAVLAVRVDQDGRISDAKLVKTSEQEYGEEAAVRVNTWVVNPGRLRGKPVACTTALLLRTEVKGRGHTGAFTTSAVFLQPPDSPPKPIDPSQPSYPAALLGAGISGSALIQVTVSEEGRILEATVVKASDPAFGLSARDCVLHWEFSPGIKAGKRAKMTLQIPFVFEPPHTDG